MSYIDNPTPVAVGTVTSVAGGVGITNTPEPITGAGTVDLDISSLGLETVVNVLDRIPFVDISVGTGPTAQRYMRVSSIAGTINPILDHSLLDAITLTFDDHLHYLNLNGRAGGQTGIGGTSSSDHLDLHANTTSFAGGSGRVRIFHPSVILGSATTDTSFTAITIGNGAAWSTSGGDLHKCLVFNPSITYTTTTPLFGLLPQVLTGQPTFTFDVTGSIQAAPLFFSGPAYVVATGRTVTLSDVSATAAFWDNPTFSREGTGAYDAAATYNGFCSAISIGTGAALNTRRSYRVVDAAGAGSLTNQIGIEIPVLAKGGTLNIGIRNASSEVNTPAVGTISAATSAIPHTARCIRLNNTSGGAVTLTSAPTVTDGSDGELLTIFNGSANAVTIQDQGTLAGSNLRLSTNTFAIGQRDSITLIYSTTIGDWIEISRTNVL